ncbi:hypothetical protein P8610_17175 [Fictibacillus sp. UD]|uniref:hypothetical protein n=1 Tax=Fictibacillus sp. UD TaxID=3038777 RepID=UPI003744F4E0
MRDSCGTSGQVRPLTAQSGKGLTACPAESEAPETEINHFQNPSKTSYIPIFSLRSIFVFFVQCDIINQSQ